MSTAEAPEAAVRLLPFGVEIDHFRNCDVAIQSIPGAKLRSRITASRTVKDAKTGAERYPRDQMDFLGQYPEIPGMQLHVNPNTGDYQIIDPLCGNEALCETIRKRMVENTPFRTSAKLEGVPTQKGKLDKHRMKTLCREILNLVEADEARLCKGDLPSHTEVDGLAGNYLLNPGSRIDNGQPAYEKDFETWKERLNLQSNLV